MIESKEDKMIAGLMVAIVVIVLLEALTPESCIGGFLRMLGA